MRFPIVPLYAVAYNGEMIDFEMKNSKIYPGTARKITVYVPKEYDGVKPACLLVKLDKGEGSLGKLINDKTIHDEVEGLTRDVRQVLDNYRDTTPISTFGSLIMGGL